MTEFEGNWDPGTSHAFLPADQVVKNLDSMSDRGGRPVSMSLQSLWGEQEGARENTERQGERRISAKPPDNTQKGRLSLKTGI